MSETASPLQPAPPPGQPFDTRAFRRTLGRFATGVTVVTCLDGDGAPVGMTANSFSSVSLEPPLVLWSVSHTAHGFAAFTHAQRFAFSVLALGQVDLSNRFARPGTDKFAGVAWTAGEGGVPRLAGASAYLESRRHAAFPGGDHTILVGEVTHFSRTEDPALVFADGRYAAVSPHPGLETPAEQAPPTERHPYDDFLLPLLFRGYTHLFRNFSETLEAEAATGAQMRVLSVLASRGPSRPLALLTASLLSQSSLEEACHALAAQGLITQGADRRYAITAEGHAKLADLLTVAAERERHSTMGLDPAETEILRTLLRKLVHQHEGDADADHDPDGPGADAPQPPDPQPEPSAGM